MSLTHSIPTPEQRTWRRIHAALDRWYAEHGGQARDKGSTVDAGLNPGTPAPENSLLEIGKTRSLGPTWFGERNPAAGTPAIRERAGAGPQAEEAKL